MSRVDHQRKSCKVGESLFQVFKVALSMCHECITNQKVVKLRSLYIKCLKLCCVCIKNGSPKRKGVKVAESLYQVFKVALPTYQEWITKLKVLKMRSLYFKCLKLCCLCIKSGSPKKK